MSWDIKGDLRMIWQDMSWSRQARKRYPRKNRSELLSHDVLLVLQGRNKTLGVYEMCQDLKLGMGFVGHLYQVLALLERQQLVAGCRLEAHDSRARKGYMITDSGRRAALRQPPV